MYSLSLTKLKWSLFMTALAESDTGVRFQFQFQQAPQRVQRWAIDCFESWMLVFGSYSLSSLPNLTASLSMLFSLLHHNRLPHVLIPKAQSTRHRWASYVVVAVLSVSLAVFNSFLTLKQSPSRAPSTSPINPTSVSIYAVFTHLQFITFWPLYSLHSWSTYNRLRHVLLLPARSILHRWEPVSVWNASKVVNTISSYHRLLPCLCFINQSPSNNPTSAPSAHRTESPTPSPSKEPTTSPIKSGEETNPTKVHRVNEDLNLSGNCDRLTFASPCRKTRARPPRQPRIRWACFSMLWFIIQSISHLTHNFSIFHGLPMQKEEKWQTNTESHPERWR